MKSVLQAILVALCLVPLANAQSVYTMSTPTTATAQPNIQAAVNAAGTTGWVVIPSSYQSTANITGFSITSNIATFSAANTLQAGQGVTISGLSTGTYFNGRSLIVLSTGLSSTQFEAAFTHANVGTTSDSGLASCCSDSWTTPNSISVIDERALSNPNAAIQIVNAAQYGALCNGIANDTAAIQAALNAAYVYNVPLIGLYNPGGSRYNMAVQLPQGSCVITAPLHIGLHGGLIGQGDATYIVADYGHWSGSDYNAIEVQINGTQPGGAAIGPRTIGNFTLYGVNNSALASTTGVFINNQANIYDPNQHAIPNLNFNDIQIAGFDVCFLAEDWVNSSITRGHIGSCRIGLYFTGDVQNINISDTYVHNGTWVGTTHGNTIGMLLSQNSKYTGFSSPQGIYFHDSAILTWDYNLDQESCVGCMYRNDAIDYAGGPNGGATSIQLGASALAGGGLWISDSYIGTNSPSGYAIYSFATSNNVNNNGLWITDNQFLLDNSQSPTSAIGVVFGGASTISGATVRGNTFTGFTEAMAMSQNVQYSTITENKGFKNTAYFINLYSSGTALNHGGTVIENNTDVDNIPVLNEGSTTGFRLGLNQSGSSFTNPTQLTGTQVASGPGCSISGGAIGGTCSVTVSLPVSYPASDTSYSIDGCTLTGASSAASLTTVGSKNPNQFTIIEVAMSTSAVSGGTAQCTVNHQ